MALRGFFFSLLGVLATLGAGCGDDAAGDGGMEVDSGPGRDADMVVRCSMLDDPDGDFISGMDEGNGDPDGDGRFNLDDPDSDGDGIGDVDEAGDRNCATPPVDTDDDEMPDYLDLDSNFDGETDEDQAELDTDGDGIRDAHDIDTDGDAIRNPDEMGEDGAQVDTDGDGTPDVFDRDSDGDTIDDLHDGFADHDMDGDRSFRDTDSDGDGILDSIEAGDGDIATPPVACGNEVDPVSGEVRGDGFADFADLDSDNDGLSDGDEVTYGTDPCDIDTDDDTFSDLVEGAYESIGCPDGTTGEACGCATAASCGIPPEDYYVVLPYGGPPEERELEFGTTIRVADIFFVTDTTGSMGGTLSNVQNTVARAGTGIIDRAREIIPDAWFGGGEHKDFPFGFYGGGGDNAFRLGARMTPPDRSSEVAAAFRTFVASGGADGPESQSEALYQIMTGEGGTWMGSGGFGGGTMYTMPRYVGDCLDSGYGAPCFRDAALPIIILFTDICSHNGPPGEDFGSCDNYTGITPAPALWEDAIREMNLRGAKFIGVNVTGSTCVGVVSGGGYSPCYFLKRTAEETGSIDLDGNPLVFDVPNGSGDATFVDAVVGAIEIIATRVPLDVDTALRDDAGDPLGVDATRFIKRRRPACHVTMDDTCWTEPAGLTHADAVAAYDESTFFGVIPGTLVRFRITFQNDFQMGDTVVRVFIAYIDVRGGGSAVLDTRQVFIVVPASAGGLG